MRSNFRALLKKIFPQKYEDKIKLSKTSLFLFVAIFSIVTLPRALGLMQPFELMVLDIYFKNRPKEAIDKRIVIVGITEEDYRKLYPYYPIDDAILAELLLKIKKQSPTVIGLDLFRDLPVLPRCEERNNQQRWEKIFSEIECENGAEKLLSVFRNTNNLFGIEKVAGGKKNLVSPNPILLQEGRNSAADLPLDPDGFLRRGLLVTFPSDENREAIANFSYTLAAVYLDSIGIEYSDGDNNAMIYGEQRFDRFRANDGSYVNAIDSGNQIIINWRTPPDRWQTIPLFDVLENKIPADIFKDKIVIIGAVNESSNDFFEVPYYRRLFEAPKPVYGVQIHANIVSQIISAVLDDRPLIKVLPDSIEYLTIAIAIAVTIFGVNCADKILKQKKSNILLLSATIVLAAILGSSAIIYISSESFVINGLWFPVVPVILGIWVSASAMFTTISATRAIEYQANLKKTNANLKQFLEGLPVGVFISDRAGNPYYVNKAAKRILGSRLDSIKTAEQLKQVYPVYGLEANLTHSPQIEWPIFLALKGEEVKAKDLEVATDLDRKIPIEVDATPIYNEVGEVTYAIAAFQDISERERLKRENQLLQPLDNSSRAYQLGGSLPALASSYVVRSADRQLYQEILRGNFCYVFNARQMGKSSLRNRITSQLQERGYRCVIIDMTKIGSTNLAIEKWYGGLVFNLTKSLQISNFGSHTKLSDWWQSLDLLSPVNKFKEFIYEILLPNVESKIAIFFDEIDSVRRLSFNTDDFFGLIRFFYDDRAIVSQLNRITFVFLGAASPNELISDFNATPFNIGRAISLKGFKIHETQPLLAGIRSQCDSPTTVMEEILVWTGGQPFLTQKICYFIRESSATIPRGIEAEYVEKLVRERIIIDWTTKDDPKHLRVIQDNVLKNPNKSQLLKIYQQLLEGQPVAWDDSQLQQELVLSGLVDYQDGFLKIFNQIYANIFNLTWCQENLSVD